MQIAIYTTCALGLAGFTGCFSGSSGGHASAVDSGTPADGGSETGQASDGGRLDPCRNCAGECTNGICQAPNANAPEILSLSVNTSTPTENDTIVFSAIVTDPDGLDNLLGGVLEDPDGGGSYGTFTAAGTAGSYSFSMTAFQVSTLRPLDTVSGSTTTERDFRAVFVDADAHRTAKLVQLLFHCSRSSEIFCAAARGLCVDTSIDAKRKCSSGHRDPAARPSAVRFAAHAPAKPRISARSNM